MALYGKFKSPYPAGHVYYWREHIYIYIYIYIFYLLWYLYVYIYLLYMCRNRGIRNKNRNIMKTAKQVIKTYRTYEEKQKKKRQQKDLVWLGWVAAGLGQMNRILQKRHESSTTTEQERKNNKPGAGIVPKSGTHGVTLIHSVPLILIKKWYIRVKDWDKPWQTD